MYSKIVDEYLTNYQNAVAGTVLDDANTIEQMKQESLKSLEEQKKEYGPMGNTKIVGKDSLVEFLKNYRNGLKEYTDNISTYNDYLTMYSKIVDEYLTNYQNAVAGTVLDDANTIEQMKQETLKSLEEQKKEYGSMGNTKIVGKDSLVEFLKNYRNGLKEYTDNISTQIQ